MRSRRLPSFDLPLNALSLAGAIAASAVASLILVRAGVSGLAVGAVALVGVFALLRWPALSLLSLLVVCEEVNSSDGFAAPGASGLIFLGHQLYFTTIGRISLITFVTVLACAGSGLRHGRRRPHLGAVSFVAVLGIWGAALVWLGGSSVTTAINQDSRFALLFVGAFFVGTVAAHARDFSVHALTFFCGLFTLMALIGAYLYATGQGDSIGGTSVIFYDSALGAIAGAFIIAVVLAPRKAQTRQLWWTAGAALIVVILSSRRNVWAAMAVALLIGLAVTRNRTRVILRVVGTVLAVLAALALLDPSVLGAVGHQLSAIWEATQGSAADVSVKGHLRDVSVGWHAVLASPWSGIGPTGQIPGLVVEHTGTLYIHNQILESWLRFGIVAAALIVTVQVVLVSQGIGALRGRADEMVTSWAAYLLIMAPVTMLTAPFFTNTERWPCVVGLAAGLVAARPRRAQRSPAPMARPA